MERVERVDREVVVADIRWFYGNSGSSFYLGHSVRHFFGFFVSSTVDGGFSWRDDVPGFFRPPRVIAD